MAIKRALSIANLESYRPVEMDFRDEWEASFGKPEVTGTWIIWGGSGEGKTRFALQLAKQMAQHKRVAYNPLEEGLSKTFKKAVLEVGMKEVAKRIIVLDKEPIDELKERLRAKKNSPDVIFIDSLQYTGMSYTQYKSLKDEFRNKLFVFISHADGSNPRGNVAQSIRYDANVKIYVDGFKAFPTSRYGGGEAFVIWEIGARERWG